jgi:hypothetical protein
MTADMTTATAMKAVDQSKVFRGRRWMGGSDDKLLESL